MPKYTLIDLMGQTINRWQVLRRATHEETIANGKRVSGSPYWICKCSCEFGTTKLVLGKDLRSGNSKSCRRCSNRRTSRSHGRCKTKAYRAWNSIKTRCYNPSSPTYRNYGGRGIKVCDRWLKSFEDFYSDVGDPPSDKHSLDRYPDVNGNYEPGNVRWATHAEQCNNKRTNVYVDFNGRRQTATQWARELNIPAENIWRQMKVWGDFDPSRCHAKLSS